MTENELALRGDENRGAIQLLLDLEVEGKADDVSLTLTDPDMTYDSWEALGRFLGKIDKRTRWYIGDWLNFGEAIFGHEAAQAIEATQKDRYSEIERVTGLDHATILNIQSLCRRVKRAQRREELGFWVHTPVSPLEPAEQELWLQRTIDAGWTRKELADAIKDANNPPTLDPASTNGNSGHTEAAEPGLSRSERLEAAARLVYQQGQSTSEGTFVVPPEPWAQLASALGEE